MLECGGFSHWHKAAHCAGGGVQGGRGTAAGSRGVLYGSPLLAGRFLAGV